MLRINLFVAILFIVTTGYSQKDSTQRFNVGIEQDILPYLTGGYFAAVWAGKNHLRARVITARVHKPDFVVEDGFTNNDVTAYALLADYFINENWKGWWAGTGPVYWRSSIQTDEKTTTAYYNTWLWNGSLGYNFKFCKNFYAGPWAGLNIRIAGDNPVLVDNEPFTPPLLNPEASIKIGAYF